MIRSCTFCLEPIPPRLVLCSRCFEQYREYIKEPWFQALIPMQVRQDYISHREGGSLTEYMHQTSIHSDVLRQRNAGRPRKLNRQDEDAVLAEFEKAFDAWTQGTGERLSYRALARKYGCNRMTIQRIIQRRGNNEMLVQLRELHQRTRGEL